MLDTRAEEQELIGETISDLHQRLRILQEANGRRRDNALHQVVLTLQRALGSLGPEGRMAIFRAMDEMTRKFPVLTPEMDRQILRQLIVEGAPKRRREPSGEEVEHALFDVANRIKDLL